MKIAFVIDDTMDKPDGVQQYTIALGDWYSSQGHEVHYLCGATARTDLANLHPLSRNIPVRFNGNRLTVPLPANKSSIRRLLDREQFDVLHVQMPYSPFLAGRVIAAAPPSTYIAGTFHILPYSWLVRIATSVLGVWLRGSLQRFDYICAVSPAAQVFASKAFRLDDVVVMPNVASVDKFRRAEPLSKYVDGHSSTNNPVPTIMFLGRLVPRKGCATLLQAASLLLQQTGKTTKRPFRIVVCGKGPLAAELESMAERLGLSGIVEFVGFVSEADKPRYIASADIMVFPSSGGESFGIVLIEAMASSRPVVLAGDNDGYASVMQPRPESLFDPHNPEELAQKLKRYIDNVKARQEAVDWQTKYVSQFDTAVVGRQLLECYQTERLRKSSKP